MYGESLMLVNPRRKGRRSKNMLSLGGVKKMAHGVDIKDVGAGAVGAVATLVLPKMAPYGWGYGLKGVISSAVTTLVAGGVTYMATKSNKYAAAVILGGGIITALRALKVITRGVGVRPVGLEGVDTIAQVPEEELLQGLGNITAYTSRSDVKVV